MRRRWLLETFWGNVAVLPLMALLAFYAARRGDAFGCGLFVFAVLGVANCACNMGIIVAVDNERARSEAAVSPKAAQQRTVPTTPEQP